MRFNPKDFVTFELMPDSPFINRTTKFPLQYFRKYVDENGEVVEEKFYTYSERNDGEPVRVKFDKSTRYVRIPKGKHEFIDAMRNYPRCQGSPSGDYKYNEADPENDIQVGVLFREVNRGKEGEVIVDAAKLKFTAQRLVFELLEDEAKTEAVCRILNVFNVEATSMSHAQLILLAEKEPKLVIDTITSPELKARALVKKAISQDIIQKQSGSIQYVYGDIEFGIDEDDVVREVLRDKDKYKILEKFFRGE